MDLGADADAVTYLYGGDLRADLDGMTDDLCRGTTRSVHAWYSDWDLVFYLGLTVAGNQGPDLVAPSSRRSVHIRTTHAAGDDLDVDVMVAEGFRFELVCATIISKVTKA